VVVDVLVRGGVTGTPFSGAEYEGREDRDGRTPVVPHGK
jgi:hypothetical protein